MIFSDNHQIQVNLKNIDLSLEDQIEADNLVSGLLQWRKGQKC